MVKIKINTDLYPTTHIAYGQQSCARTPQQTQSQFFPHHHKPRKGKYPYTSMVHHVHKDVVIGSTAHNTQLEGQQVFEATEMHAVKIVSVRQYLVQA